MKINKFLEQVVTVDHVAEVLTEKEIEEAIEQTEAELEDVIEDIEKQQTYKEYVEGVLQTLKQAREMKLVGNSTVKTIGDEAREFWQGSRLLGEDVDRFTDIPQKSLPDNSFVHTTPDGRTFRVVDRRAKIGERVVIIDDLTLDVFKVGDVEKVKGLSESQTFEVIGCRELGFWGYDYLNHKIDYYVIIEELPF